MINTVKMILIGALTLALSSTVSISESTSFEIERTIVVPSLGVRFVEYEFDVILKEILYDYNNVCTPSNASPSQVDLALVGTGLEGLGYAYINAENWYGINAMVLIGITAQESGWGTSKLALEKNNLSGFMAYDNDPYNSAMTFESQGDSIIATAKLLQESYVSIGLVDLKSINSRYATDKEWHNKVNWIADSIHIKIMEGTYED